MNASVARMKPLGSGMRTLEGGMITLGGGMKSLERGMKTLDGGGMKTFEGGMKSLDGVDEIFRTPHFMQGTYQGKRFFTFEDSQLKIIFYKNNI